MKSPVALLLLIPLLVVSLPAAAAPRGAPRERRVEIRLTPKGFEPALIRLKAGTPAVLVVTRTTERTCATEFVLKALMIRQPLPLNRPVEIRLPPVKPGRLRFACGMDMVAGVIVVE